MDEEERYYIDEWPQVDGIDFDGHGLLSLVRSGSSPFHKAWDVNHLIKEIEETLQTEVVDIPYVYHGSNNYGFRFELSNRPDVVACIARADVNRLDYDGFPLSVQVPQVEFEAASLNLLQADPSIKATRLLYHRIPVQTDGPKLLLPVDITGRRLLVFERAEGENNIWKTLSSTSKKPDSLPVPVTPTRGFCLALLTSKLEATIKNLGDIIGWEDDDNTVGPRAFAAKQSLLKVLPHILPEGDDSLYRLVLEHDDFGIHNMYIKQDSTGEPLVTSLYDWETACICPALLFWPEMAVIVDLVTDDDGQPELRRVRPEDTEEEVKEFHTWSKHYFEVLFHEAPDYKRAIAAGKDARHLWFALKDWRGDDPEDYFGKLGDWAEKRLAQINAGPADRGMELLKLDEGANTSET